MIKTFAILSAVVKGFLGIKAEVERDEMGSPWYLRRTTIGVVLTAVSAIAAAITGITIPDDIAQTLAEPIGEIVKQAGLLWGVILTVIGIVKREKK